MREDDVKQGINEYIHSRFSVADDDRLREFVTTIPVGTVLNIAAVDTDSIGNPCVVHMHVKKVDVNLWEITTHWCFESGCKIWDSTVAHSLVYILRCRKLTVNCSLE